MLFACRLCFIEYSVYSSDDSFHDDGSDAAVKRSHKVRLNSTLLDKDGAKDIDEIPPFTTLSAVDGNIQALYCLFTLGSVYSVSQFSS